MERASLMFSALSLLVSMDRSIATVPPSWALWTAHLTLPPNVSIATTQRGGDPGYGVDLSFSKSTVNASVWDDDGDAYFMLQHGSAFCKVSVGSDGLGPRLQVEVFQQRGLDCNVVHATGGPKDFALHLSADLHLGGTADCDSTSYDPSHTRTPCNMTWRAPHHAQLHKRVPSPKALWKASIALPSNFSIRKVHRGADPGYGVDLKINASMAVADVWDDDGNAFFMLQRGPSFCKVSVGSDGPSPGLQIEIFQQHGLDCNLVNSSGGPKNYAIRLSADVQLNGAADCDSSSYDPSHAKNLCNKTWSAPWNSLLHREAMLLKKVPSSWALWTARIALPPSVSIRKVARGNDPGYGVDLQINGSTVNANIWDDDGDAYFMLRNRDASCKVSIGSNGLGPGLEVEVFQQQGMACNVVDGVGGPKAYALTMSADTQLDGNADCDSTYCPDGACPSKTKNTCKKVWRPVVASVMLV